MCVCFIYIFYLFNALITLFSLLNIRISLFCRWCDFPPLFFSSSGSQLLSVCRRTKDGTFIFTAVDSHENTRYCSAATLTPGDQCSGHVLHMHTTIQLYLRYLHSHTTRILSVMPWWLREQKQRGEKRTNAEYFRPIILSTFTDRQKPATSLAYPLYTHTDKHAACTLCNLASTNFAGTNKIHTLNFVIPSIVHVFHVCEGLTPAPSRILNAGTLT